MTPPGQLFTNVTVNPTVPGYYVVNLAVNPVVASNCEAPQQQGEDSATTLTISVHRILFYSRLHAKVIAFSPDGKHGGITVWVLLDTGCQRTYVPSRLRQALNVQSLKKECLLIKTFGNNFEQIENCNLVQLCLQSIRDDLSLLMKRQKFISLCKTRKLTQLSRSFYILKVLNLQIFVKGLKLKLSQAMSQASHNLRKLVTGNVIKSGLGPVAIGTVFGWVISGPVDEVSATSQYSINLVDTHLLLEVQTAAQLADESLDNQFRKFWEIESLGILPDVSPVHDKFKENTNLHEGRYCVGLTWKDNHPVLPDNYQLYCEQIEIPA